MIDPFSDALDRLYVAPGSLAATYTPPGGAPVPVRLIREQEDADTGLGGNRKLQHANMFSVRKSDVSLPVPGARVAIIGGEEFEVLAEPKTDTEGLSWTFGAAPV